jgi:hypothetical protein
MPRAKVTIAKMKKIKQAKKAMIKARKKMIKARKEYHARKAKVEKLLKNAGFLKTGKLI